MKKIIIVLLSVGLLVSTVGAIVFIKQKSNVKTTTRPAASPNNILEISPDSKCDQLLTLDEVNTLTAKTYTNREAESQFYDNISVTTCTYIALGNSISIRPISILTRSASTVDEANQIFEESKTVAYKDAEPLTELSSNAIWSPSFSQVSVLKGQTWLIVTALKDKNLAISLAREILNNKTF